jgi:tRNA(Ile)-lysidine synthetase-like protein
MVVACSGGADSLALAHKLRHKSPTLYHFNHRLLPNGGDDYIARDCVRVAKELGLPIVVGESRNVYSKGSVEDYCRKQRYEWFSQLGGTLLMAQHLSDCVENYVQNCLRGCPEYLPIPISTQFGATTILRPLILTPKKEVEKYLDKHDLRGKVVEDKLNHDLSKQRNFIRKNIIPEINKLTNLEKVVLKRYLKKL